MARVTPTRPARQRRWPLGPPACRGLLLALAVQASWGAGGAWADEGDAPVPPPEPGQPAPDAPAPEPLGWRVGALTLLPRVGLTEAYNDNIDYAESQRQGSRVRTWSPSLGLSLPHGDDRYELALRGELTRYASVPANDVHNAEAVLDAVNLTGEHSAVAWRMAWQDAHEDVGNSPLSELASTPNRFLARALGAVWRLDSADGEHRGEFEATVSRKTYLNHRETARVGDVTTRAAVARYLCTVAPATRLLAELRDVGARYSARETALDNADQRWLVGVQREAGDDPQRQLTGGFKLGLQVKQFDRLRPTYEGLTWELGLQWRPRPATQWELASSRIASDAPGDGSNWLLARNDTLAWTELWPHGLRSTLVVSNGRQRHVYPGAFARQDSVRGYDLGLRHEWTPHWQWGWTHSVADRRSAFEGFGFSRRVDALVVEAAW
ncbi:MAG: outer membrane beta-barrel protein [Burkholderiaceae bacterium]